MYARKKTTTKLQVKLNTKLLLSYGTNMIGPNARDCNRDMRTNMTDPEAQSARGSA